MSKGKASESDRLEAELKEAEKAVLLTDAEKQLREVQERHDKARRRGGQAGTRDTGPHL
jgi:hypothetical protein